MEIWLQYEKLKGPFSYSIKRKKLKLGVYLSLFVYFINLFLLYIECLLIDWI